MIPTIDGVRRECIRLGTMFSLDKGATVDARAVISAIQIKAEESADAGKLGELNEALNDPVLIEAEADLKKRFNLA